MGRAFSLSLLTFQSFFIEKRDYIHGETRMSSQQSFDYGSRIVMVLLLPFPSHEQKRCLLFLSVGAFLFVKTSLLFLPKSNKKARCEISASNSATHPLRQADACDGQKGGTEDQAEAHQHDEHVRVGVCAGGWRRRRRERRAAQRRGIMSTGSPRGGQHCCSWRCGQKTIEPRMEGLFCSRSSSVLC